MNIKQERFIRTIIESKKTLSNSEIKARLNSLDITIQIPFVICEIEIETSHFSYMEIDNAINRTFDFVEDKLSRYNALCYINEYENIQIILSKNIDLCGPIVEEVLTYLSKECHVNAYGTISNLIDDYSEIALKAIETHEALNYISHSEGVRVIYVNKIRHLFSNSLLKYTDIYDNVINAFLKGDSLKMSVALSTLAEAIRQKPTSNKTSIRRALIEVTIRIINIAAYSNINVDEILNGIDPYNAILSMTKTEDIIAWIMEISKKLINKSENTNVRTDNINIKKAMNFIENNFSNPNISLQMISDILNLNSSYFSKMFSDNIGISVTNYITNIRILNAKRLLVETNLPVSDIATRCGFNEITYFAIIFKKRVGKTALQFRNNK